MKIHICSFQDGPDVTRKTQYPAFRAAVLKAGRFSAFEATANEHAAELYTRLCSDPEIETDKSCGFPWTKVRLKEPRP